MDGSHFTPDNLEATVDKYIDEIIHDGTTAEVSELLEILEQFDGCECGCRGRLHMREVYQIIHHLTRLRNQINISIPD